MPTGNNRENSIRIAIEERGKAIISTQKSRED